MRFATKVKGLFKGGADSSDEETKVSKAKNASQHDKAKEELKA